MFIKKDGQRYIQITRWAVAAEVVDVESVLFEPKMYIIDRNEEGLFATFMNVEELLETWG